MSRTLTAARVQVPEERIEEYLAAAAALAAACRLADRHFWLFRDPRRIGRFLEFHEWATHAPPAPELAPLAAALAAVGRRESDAAEQWTEVPLTDPE